ncbi:MAG: radical SAM family heme chaperone HemW [Desulfobacterales bacterium]|jgi:oxygen-independent coproporphyrinogen-3 oxidase
MNLPYSKNAGLYIHIPFCVRKCPYCDFYSVTDLTLKPRFLKALITEMELVSTEGLSFDTVYIGGGTPSVCESDEIDRMITHAFESFEILADAEITIEVNPGTVNLEQLTGFRKAGINRINIGVQSFQQTNLDFLGRIHSIDDAGQALIFAREAGFDKVGIDLIFGLPGQSMKDWLLDLQQAVDFQPAHLSCYMLTFENGTPMNLDLKLGRFQQLSEDGVRVLFESTIEFLEDNGYFQYEISNFAMEEDRGTNVSRHNLKYWTLAPYIGLGPSAHSYIDSRRHWNVASAGQYITAIESGQLPVADQELLTLEQQRIEVIYLGLRMTSGIDLRFFKNKFGVGFIETHKEVVAELEKDNYIEATKSHCALTRKGRAYLDSITSMLLA